jgi:hypothetical protein
MDSHLDFLVLDNLARELDRDVRAEPKDATELEVELDAMRERDLDLPRIDSGPKLRPLTTVLGLELPLLESWISFLTIDILLPLAATADF